MVATGLKNKGMTYEKVMTQLEGWGSEGVRRIYAKQGAGEDQFGVKLGDLRGLAKVLKMDHPLALQLWESGNYDAMLLATILMDPSQLSEPQVEAMLAPLSSYRLVDELVYNVVQKASCAESLRLRWMDSPDELTGRAGWNLLIARMTRNETSDLDLDALLAQIEAEMQAAPHYKQESMNRVLVDIAVRFPERTVRCIAIGERLSRLDNRPIPKGCTSSYAPEWIAALQVRGRHSTA